ncbi:response regulator transcription factor [Aeromicrobium erythreum]|uniref:Transcriptional regulator n=1 Tax=Aeromicrobium erythreum TaxID=2041 RepID=A0A0U4B8I5_9ACTN|nr:response regulator transcription factor [Aeromicrobium erythreum]ALX04297.1 transcriptional regulator [Aeromicrobium erythreum]
MDVLLVEDDETIRTGLQLTLEREGYTVRTAGAGPAGLAAFFERRPDLVLLDVMLPGLDGVAVCRTIRSDSIVPVVMLTARTTPADVVAGLEAGADDYVEKPFVPEVLLARLRSVLRRTGTRAREGQLWLGGCFVDVDAMEVRRDGERLAVTPTEFRLIVELARHAGEVRSRRDLLAAVWDYEWDGDTRLVDVHVQRLRAKIGQDAIETVWGVGYRAVRT